MREEDVTTEIQNQQKRRCNVTSNLSHVSKWRVVICQDWAAKMKLQLHTWSLEKPKHVEAMQSMHKEAMFEVFIREKRPTHILVV